MNRDKRRKLMKTNFLCGILLLTTGFMLEANVVFPDALSVDILNADALNLNIKEIDTSYDKEEKKTVEEKKEEVVTPIPMANVIDTSWGWPTSMNYGITTYYNSGHPAIDIIVYDGNYNIYSASSGVVVTDSYKWDGGNYLIILQDNGYYALYCHLSDKTVGLNQRVEKGQVIGHMGRTGLATGVHLHYSIWKGYPYYGGYSINPFNFY